VNSCVLSFCVAPVSNPFTFSGHAGDVIDWARITELENDLGVDELTGLVSVFLAEVGAAVSTLDHPTEAELHFLRGCASTLGFSDLAHLAGQGEDRLKRDAAAAVDCHAIKCAYSSEKSEFLTRFPEAE